MALSQIVWSLDDKRPLPAAELDDEKELEALLEEHHYQKHQDEAVVHKVNRLKDAIEELSDGEEMDFSVAELSAYLDLSVEEIEDILRLTGEDQ